MLINILSKHCRNILNKISIKTEKTDKKLAVIPFTSYQRAKLFNHVKQNSFSSRDYRHNACHIERSGNENGKCQ